MRFPLFFVLVLALISDPSAASASCKAPHKRRWYTRHNLPFPCDPTPTPTATPSPPAHTPTPTPTATPSSSPTATPTPTPNPASAATLSWHASSDPVAGYYLRYGSSSGDHPARMDVGNVTRADIYLPSGNYFFVCTAYLPGGIESKPSNELEVVIQ